MPERDFAALCVRGQHRQTDLHGRHGPFAAVDNGRAVDDGVIQLVHDLVAIEPRRGQCLEPALAITIEMNALSGRPEVGALARGDDQAEVLMEALWPGGLTSSKGCTRIASAAIV